MALLSPIVRTEIGPIVERDAVMLRYPQQRDYAAWASLRSQSRSYLTPWEPTWPSDDLTRTAFRRRLRRYAKDVREDLAYPFFIFRSSDEVLLGSVILSNVRRGVTQAGTVGYWTGEPYAGRGYMTMALRALVDFAFGHLGLHRLEAACLPQNHGSQRVLTKAGFQKEGNARSYLKINGRWEDHVLFGMVENRWPAGLGTADFCE